MCEPNLRELDPRNTGFALTPDRGEPDRGDRIGVSLTWMSYRRSVALSFVAVDRHPPRQATGHVEFASA